MARFCQRYWEPAHDHTGQVIRPGLESAKRDGTFNANIATELLELREVLQAAQTRYRLLVSTPEAAPFERAQFVLSELRATLEWYFDDNVTDEHDAQLQRLIESHDAGLGGFDVALLEESVRSPLAGPRQFA